MLDLSFNSLTRLDFHPGLVENLRLDNNQIRFITSDFFRGRPEFTNNLKKLNLRSNRIIALPDCTFCHFINLRELDVRYNLLKTFNPTIFGLTHLEKNGTYEFQNQRVMCSCENILKFRPFMNAAANIEMDCRPGNDVGWRKQISVYSYDIDFCQSGSGQNPETTEVIFTKAAQPTTTKTSETDKPMTVDLFEVEVSFESDHNEAKPSARGVDIIRKNPVGETIFDDFFGSGEDPEIPKQHFSTTQSVERFTPAVTVKTEILEKFEDPEVLYESVKDLLERWNIKSTSQTALTTRKPTKLTTMLASEATSQLSQIKNNVENKNEDSLLDQISLDQILVADQAFTTIEGTTFGFSTTTVSTIEYSTTLTTTEQTTTENVVPLQKSIFQNPHIPLFSFVQRNERVIPNSPTARVITTPISGKMTTSKKSSTSSMNISGISKTSSTTSTTKTTSTSSITLSTLSQKKIRQLEKARIKRINGLKSQMMKKFYKQKVAEEKRNRNQVRALVKNAKQTKEKQKRMKNQFVLDMRRLDSLETQRIQAEMREIELQNAIEAQKNRQFFDLIEKINTTTTTTTSKATTTKTTVTSTTQTATNVSYSTQKPTQNTLTKSDGKLNLDDLRVFLPSNLLPSLEPSCQKFAILISKMLENGGRMNKNFFDHQLKRCRIYNLRNAILHFIGKILAEMSKRPGICVGRTVPTYETRTQI